MPVTVATSSPQGLINTYTLGNQLDSTVIGLSGGGYLVAWQSDDQGQGSDIYAQRYGSAGVKLGGEVRLNTTVTGDQTAPQLAALNTGGFVATWVSAGQDGSGGAIVAQRYDAAGLPVGGETLINTTTAGDQVSPQVAALAGGGYVVTWRGPYSGSGQPADLFQVVGVDGLPVGLETRITPSSEPSAASPLGLADGSFVVAYSARFAGIVLQHFSAAGALIGSDGTVAPFGAEQTEPKLAALADGGFLVSWSSQNPDNLRTETYYRRYDAVASATGLRTTLTQSTTANSAKHDVVATGLPDGGFAFAWWEGSGTSLIHLSQRFDAAGATVGSIEILQWASEGSFVDLDIAAAAGGFVVTGTTGNHSTENQDVRQILVGGVTGAQLTTGADRVTDPTAGTVLVSPETLTPGDVFVVGSAGYTLRFGATGVYDFTGVTAHSLGRVTATSGDDTLIVRDPNAFISNLDSGGGHDKLLLSGIYGAGQLGAFTGNWTIGATPDSILTLRLNSGSDRAMIDGHGGTVVVEASFGLNDAQRADLFAQGVAQIRSARGAIYNADGSQRELAQSVTSYGQPFQDSRAEAAPLPGGGYLIVYNNISGPEVVRYDALGFSTGGHALSQYSGQNHEVAVSVLADGGYVVAWEHGAAGATVTSVMAQRFTAAGLAVGGAFTINTTLVGENGSPTLASLPGGGFVAAWTASQADGSGDGIYMRSYGADMAPVGGEVRVSAVTAGNQNAPAAVSLDGGYVIAWVSADQDGSGRGIFAQRFDLSGAKVGAEVRVNTATAGDQFEPAVARLNDGGYIIAWTSFGQDGDQGGIFAQRYDGFGAAVGGEVAVSQFGAGHQSHGSVAALGNGGFVIVWQSFGQDHVFAEAASLGVYAQEFTAAGVKVGPELLVNGGLGTASGTAFDQIEPSVAARDGGYVVTWYDAVGAGRMLTRSVTSYDPLVLTGSLDNFTGSDLDTRFYTAPADLSAGDLIRGGLGADSLILTAPGVLNLTLANTLLSVETLVGSSGADTILTSVQRLAEVTAIDAGGGADILQLSAAGVLDLSRITLTGLETVVGSGGADTFVMNTPNVLAVLDGGAGADTLSFANATTGQSWALGGGAGQTVQLVSIENLTGSAYADTLAGDGGANVLLGGAGSDLLYGLDGNDILNGGGGTSSAPDYLYGGAGNDTYYVASTLTSPLDLVFEGTLFAGSEAGVGDIDSIHSTSQFFWDYYSVGEVLYIDNAITDGAYLVGGKDVADKTIFGSSGTDLISTYGHNARVDAGAGPDAISFSLYGLDESYRGANTVVMKAGNGADYVYDFRSGTDHIDLSAFHFGITGQQVLDQAVNVDNPGTANDYSYFYLTNAGGVDNYIVFMGLLSNQLHAGDFIT